MSNEEISLSNARKLDRIVYLLEGNGVDSPGLVHRVAMIDELLMGRHGKNGLAHKVNIMWRVHSWLLGTLSAAGGVAATLIIQRLVKP